MLQQPDSDVSGQEALDRAARHARAPEGLDQPGRGHDIAEHLRFMNSAESAEYDVDTQDIIPQLHEAIALASTNRLEPSVARELVGATHELAASLEANGNASLGPVLDELKMAVYHTTDVQPEVLRDQVRAGDDPAPITGGSMLFEWHGSPVQLTVLDQAPGMPVRPPGPAQGQGSPNITLRLGEHDTWLAQIGDQVPFPLAPNAPLHLGRRQLGHNSNISRDSHVTLRAMPPMGIEVTSKENRRTHFTTNNYPDPATWNREPQEPDQQSLLDDARNRIDHA